MILVISILLGGYAYFRFTNTKIIAEKSFVIESGLSTIDISKKLQTEEVISNWVPFAFAGILYAKFGNKYIIPGEYHVSGETSMKKLMERLLKGDRYIRKVTIPEGYTLFQIKQLLNAAEGLVGEWSINVKEGELLPDTYYYFWGDSKNQIIAKMKQAMDDLLDSVFIANEHLNDRHSLLTLASIVEKETGIGEERPRIAGVFINRLKRKMILQADPTVIYGISNGQTDYNYRLSKADLAINTPYNTYLYNGLPPGPIACPGKSSIIAALNPLSTTELYFVADGSGKHNFASSLSAHNDNVSFYKRSRKLQKIK